VFCPSAPGRVSRLILGRELRVSAAEFECGRSAGNDVCVVRRGEILPDGRENQDEAALIGTGPKPLMTAIHANFSRKEAEKRKRVNRRGAESAEGRRDSTTELPIRGKGKWLTVPPTSVQE